MPSWINMPIHSLSATARGSSTAMVLFFRYLNRHSKIDALAIEPLPPDSPLWDAPNVLISPLFKENLRRYVVGAALLNGCDLEKGY